MLDRPNALRVPWLGSMCSKAVRMQLSGSAGDLALTIQDDWDPPILGGVCPAGAVSRVVVIGFDRPVDANNVAVRMGDG